MNSKKILTFCFTACSIVLFALTVKVAAMDIAIQGYDAVAYFNKNMAVQGQEELSYEWNNEKWLFSSKENLDAFRWGPEKYAPQYHGMCAFAVAKGSQASGDPRVWEIVNEKLYFNLNQSIQSRWAQDRSGNISAADRNWQNMMNK